MCEHNSKSNTHTHANHNFTTTHRNFKWLSLAIKSFKTHTTKHAHTHTHATSRIYCSGNFAPIRRILSFRLLIDTINKLHEHTHAHVHAAQHLCVMPQPRICRSWYTQSGYNCDFTPDFLAVELSQGVHRDTNVIVCVAWLSKLLTIYWEI